MAGGQGLHSAEIQFTVHRHTTKGITMSSEIYANDSMVLAQAPAWHGFGTVLAVPPTPTEALAAAGLLWEVTTRKLYISQSEYAAPLDRFVANVRSDDGSVLGVVSPDYIPVQNAVLATLADGILDCDHSIEIETAGSLNGGKRVWMLARLPQQVVGELDTQVPYLFISNSHDGTRSLDIRLTCVRVVCANTWAIAERERSKASFRHIGLDVDNLVAVAKSAVRAAHATVAENIMFANTLSSRLVKHTDVKQFFLDAYAIQFGGIPANPTTELEEAQRDRALTGFAKFGERFDRERVVSGTSVWTLANAFTGYAQHDRRQRTLAQRISVDVFGAGRVATANTLTLASKVGQ